MSENCCASWRSPKVIIGLIVVLLVAGVLTISLIRDRIVNPPQWQVNVVGQGRVAYEPDIAKINLGVQVDKVAKAEDALTQLNDKMDKVYKAVIAAGISKEDIQTQNYSLYPQYDYVDNISRLSGYNANQSIIVKVRDIQKNSNRVSAVIAAATKAGSNQITGVAFETSLLNDLKQEARLKAIADARTKATDISSALDVRLGKIVGWWENVVSSPDTAGYYYGDGKGGSGASPTVPQGSQELIIEVNLNYRIR
ncbi:MAG: SIMPL domain-containing protein [Patescibacteria group bacterium]|nr:SIMPL domain-containing protein [Patescibacteria group bacterium]MDD5490892.1 SIMPL domain-containing protein [Patescibacteria group bacterium]